MNILLKDGVRYLPHKYRLESELQELVEKHIELLFGEDVVFIPGRRIGVPRGQRGAKGIPDGFVVFLRSRRWAIIEVELAEHPIHEHIYSQISRFSQAWKKGETTKDLVEAFYQSYKDSKLIQHQFDRFGIQEEVYRFLTSVFKSEPVVVVVIDEKAPELEDVRESVRFETRWCIFRTYRREGLVDLVPIYEYEPLDEVKGEAERKDVVSEGPHRPEGGKPVRTLVFLDRRVEFSHVWEIPVIVANDLIARGKLTEDLVPWGPGKKRYLVNKIPTHQTGKAFVAKAQLTNGWWVETHASEETVKSQTSRLIQHCGLENTEVRVEWTSQAKLTNAQLM